MTTQFEKFPKIGHFKNALKAARKLHKRGEIPASITYKGTVKLHGTNAAIGMSRKNGQWEVWHQSRNRIVTIQSDNAGFAAWCHQPEVQVLIEDWQHSVDHAFPEPDITYVIYGEYCGGNIQKGVALNQLPKMFVLFHVMIKIGSALFHGDDLSWFRTCGNAGVYTLGQVTPEFVTINLADPSQAQAHFAKVTAQVDAECPFAASLGAIGHGEGWVWLPIDPNLKENTDLWFKTKGEAHSATKVKIIAATDPERDASANAFVAATVTEQRLQQGLAFLKEMDYEISRKSTGQFLKWVGNDIIAEETDRLGASGLCWKDVSKKVGGGARDWFFVMCDQNV